MSMVSIKSRTLIDFTAALIAVTGLIMAVIYLTGAPPLETLSYLYIGSMGSWAKISYVIQTWIPLMLCTCGLLYTFRIGLWNIGVEGQMMMGAVAATAMLRWGVESGGPAPLWLGFSILSAMMGGGLWAVLAGFLKTRGRVNEIFAGLGLNFVAQGFVLWLIFGPWKQPGVASMSGTELFPQPLWMPFSERLNLSLPGVVMALGALLLTALVLDYTRFGLRLKAIGGNERAARLFGLSPPSRMIAAMLLAGGFAGLAGAFQVSGVYHRLIPAISSNYGYLALLVAMLSNYRAWITLIVALFFAGLNVGSIQLPMVLHIDSSLAGVIQGALVLSVLCIHAWRVHSGSGEVRHG
jgi:general nucleoside transport system permease protein